MARRGEREGQTPRQGASELEPELTGREARPAEAASGSAGSGASPFGADQTGLERTAPSEEEEVPLEAEPSAADVRPDRVERAAVSAPLGKKEELKRLRRGLPREDRPQGRARRGSRVREVMSQRVATLRADEEEDPQALLHRFRHVRHLPVLDASDRVVGMLTRMDVLEQVAVAGDAPVRVRRLMSEPVQTLSEDATLQAAAQTMVKARIHALPVVDAAGRLRGIVTDSDLLSAIAGTRLTAPRELEALSVDTLMTHDPVTVEERASLADAVQALLQVEARHLPVVDEEGRLVGILSDRDLRERLGREMREWPGMPGDTLGEPVGAVMTPDPLTLSPDAPVVHALDVLSDERVGALPVVDEEERVVGILSYVDVLRWLRRRLERGGGVERGEGPPVAH